MPNQLNFVLVDPGAVVSGGQTTVTVMYQAANNEDLIVSCSGAFTVSPARVALAASPNGAVRFALTVTRSADAAPRVCMIHFTLLGDERDRLVEVT